MYEGEREGMKGRWREGENQNNKWNCWPTDSSPAASVRPTTWLQVELKLQRDPFLFVYFHILLREPTGPSSPSEHD